MSTNQAFTYTNADGLIIREGPKDSVTALTRELCGGILGSLVVDFSYDNLPQLDQDAGGGTTEDTFGGIAVPVPAKSYITKATLIATEDWATADSADLTLGLYTKAGVAIDADGIDAAIAATALDLGDVVACDGALVATGVYTGTSDGYVVGAIGTGTFTTGKARLVIEYIRGE